MRLILHSTFGSVDDAFQAAPGHKRPRQRRARHSADPAGAVAVSLAGPSGAGRLAIPKITRVNSMNRRTMLKSIITN
jgi:hypothetical protein